MKNKLIKELRYLLSCPVHIQKVIDKAKEKSQPTPHSFTNILSGYITTIKAGKGIKNILES